jgi:hypothetical protein
MKTIKGLLLGLTLGMLLVSCSPEEEVKDCECDRVAYIIYEDSYLAVPGVLELVPTPGRFITLNDCTGVQLEKSGYNAVIGDCR